MEPHFEFARDVAPTLVALLAPEIVGDHNPVLGPVEHAGVIKSNAES